MVIRPTANQINARVRVALAVMRRGDFAAAWRALYAIVPHAETRADDDPHMVYRNLSFLLVKMDELPPATEIDHVISTTERCAPREPHLYDNLAGYYLRIGDRARCYERIEAAVRFGYFDSARAIYARGSGYPGLKRDRRMVNRIARLFARPNGKAAPGDLVVDGYGTWGIVYQRLEARPPESWLRLQTDPKLRHVPGPWVELLPLTGGAAWAPVRGCRVIRRASSCDFAEALAHANGEGIAALEVLQRRRRGRKD
jgi:hypothetical protein